MTFEYSAIPYLYTIELAEVERAVSQIRTRHWPSSLSCLGRVANPNLPILRDRPSRRRLGSDLWG